LVYCDSWWNLSCLPDSILPLRVARHTKRRSNSEDASLQLSHGRISRESHRHFPRCLRVAPVLCARSSKRSNGPPPVEQHPRRLRRLSDCQHGVAGLGRAPHPRRRLDLLLVGDVRHESQSSRRRRPHARGLRTRSCGRAGLRARLADCIIRTYHGFLQSPISRGRPAAQSR
jgi:hypothetical protein